MSHRHLIDVERYHEPLLAILQAVVMQPDLSRRSFNRVLKQHLKDGSGFFSADDLVAGYRALAGQDGALPPFDAAVLERLRMKPIRSASGVTPLTVFTKPYPCPGECIFCPNDVRMPKSYLADEPGAQRAEANRFDPYLQTFTRLEAFRNTGHPTDKIEIIILGGTWSFYPEPYQIWFVRRVFDALHDYGRGYDGREAVITALNGNSVCEPDLVHIHGGLSEGGASYNQAVHVVYRAGLERALTLETATWPELEAAHRENERAACRCVGLVIETRPDYTTPEEVIRLRRLGCTKVQLGFQSLNDDVLRLNWRGHSVQRTREAVRLFRRAGFKLHAHWMPNLYGSTPQADLADYRRLFDDPDFRPDELKIYPCSLIESAELMNYYRRGEWRPYGTDELTELIAACLELTPEYCRLTRVIRDIPGTDIVDGNRVTNLRQVAERLLADRGKHAQDIRAREIGQQAIRRDDLRLVETSYATSAGEEVFLQFVTEARKVAGFLRLLLPNSPSFVAELGDSAIIREVHVYGPALGLGEAAEGKAQHSGLGSALIERAASIAAERSYEQLAVISAVGTRDYYRKRGFSDGMLYQFRRLHRTDEAL